MVRLRPFAVKPRWPHESCLIDTPLDSVSFLLLARSLSFLFFFISYISLFPKYEVQSNHPSSTVSLLLRKLTRPQRDPTSNTVYLYSKDISIIRTLDQLFSFAVRIEEDRLYLFALMDPSSVSTKCQGPCRSSQHQAVLCYLYWRKYPPHHG